jgi:hypothetical protein
MFLLWFIFGQEASDVNWKIFTQCSALHMRLIKPMARFVRNWRLFCALSYERAMLCGICSLTPAMLRSLKNMHNGHLRVLLDTE